MHRIEQLTPRIAEMLFNEMVEREKTLTVFLGHIVAKAEREGVLLKRVREDFNNIPLLSIAYEGQKDSQAFVQHAPGGTGGGASGALNKVMLQDQIYFAEKWLTGDLYRRLAFEGPRLPASAVAESLALARRQLAQLTDSGPAPTRA